MSNAPTASVVIPSYNREHIVGRAIRSVLAQTYQDWELLVVDDASADDTERVVKAFGDARIRYLRHAKNRGQSAAQNTGIRAARGTYVAFLDSDDEWLPEKLEKEVAVFEASGNEVGLVYCGKTLVSEDGRVLLVRPPTLRGKVHDQLLAWDFIGSCSRVSVRKDILEAVGGFEEGLAICQDTDLWLRVSKIAEVGFVPDCLVNRYFGTDQVSGSLWTIYKGKARIVEKYRGEMPPPVLGTHLGKLAIILFNYDIPKARGMAIEALKLRGLQPALWAATAVSFLGRTVYRSLFSKSASLLHEYHVGRAAI